MPSGDPTARPAGSARINIRDRVASSQVERLCLISANDQLTAIGTIFQERRSGDLDVLVHFRFVRVLQQAVDLRWIALRVPARVKTNVKHGLAASATLTPAAGNDLLRVLADTSSEAGEIIELIQDQLLRPDQVVNQATLELHDAVSLGLRIAGFEAGTLASRRPDSETTPSSYFAQMLLTDGRPASEAAMVRHDSSHFGEWFGQEAAVLDVVEFTDPTDQRRRVTVMYADKEAEERITGADLIYYREHFPGFVLVQYKRMRKEGTEPSARYGYRPDAQLRTELERMRRTLESVPMHVGTDIPLAWWRLHDQPFYIKLVEEGRSRPERGDLVKGMYFPVDLFELLLDDQDVRGPNRTLPIGWHNAGRWLTNTNFLKLMQGGWIGSAGVATTYLQDLVSEVWATGRGAVVVEDHTPADVS